MDLSSLPEARRKQVEQRLRAKPELAPFVERLLAERAAATTERQRVRLDHMLDDAVAPRDLRAWFGVALLAVMAALVGYTVYRDRRVERAAATGTPTTARVERMETASCLGGTKQERCLTLTVTLHPASGAPYTASFTQLIPLEWMSRVQPGSWLTVAVDPAAPEHVTFDVRTMHVPPPSPPAER